MRVTSNHYRRHKADFGEIQTQTRKSRHLITEAIFSTAEPLRPSEDTLLCLAQHYERIRQSIRVA